PAGLPGPPTAVPVLASTKETPKRVAVVPLDWNVQVAPPSVLRRMIPPLPTPVPVLASTKETPKRVAVLPPDWNVQAAPPSVLRRIVPPPPTATTVLGARVTAAKRLFPCGNGFCQNQPECANDALVRTPVMPNNSTKTLQKALMIFPSP